MAHKIGLYCGHGRSTDGTWDCGTTYKSYNEAALMLKITNAAVKYLRASGITVHNDSKNEINMIKQVENANANNVELFVSIHCDYYPAPTGTMPLYLTAKGKSLANAINKRVMADLKIKTRGLTKRTDLYELNDTNMPACIFETGSIKADLSILKNDYDKYGKAIAKGICDYLKVTFKGSTTKPTTTTKKSYTGTFPTLPKHGNYRYFKKGDEGINVKRLQAFLKWEGEKLPTYGADGDYGNETVKAVKAFQKKYKLTQDGEFGNECLKKAKTIKK